MKVQQSFVLSDPSLPDMPIVHVSDLFLQLTGYPRCGGWGPGLLACMLAGSLAGSLAGWLAGSWGSRCSALQHALLDTALTPRLSLAPAPPSPPTPLTLHPPCHSSTLHPHRPHPSPSTHPATP